MVPLTMPMHPADRLAGEALAQRADERDAARDRGLEQQVAAGSVGGAEQLGTDVGEQLLVGRDDGLAVLQRGEDQLTGRLDAADDLDDDVDRRIFDDRGCVAGEQAFGIGDGTLAGRLRTATRPPRGGGRCEPRSMLARSSISPTSAAPTLPQPRTPMRTISPMHQPRWPRRCATVREKARWLADTSYTSGRVSLKNA